MSQALFPSSVALMLYQDLELTIGEYHCAKPCTACPKILSGVMIWTLVANPGSKMMSHASWTTLSQFEPIEFQNVIFIDLVMA